MNEIYTKEKIETISTLFTNSLIKLLSLSKGQGLDELLKIGEMINKNLGERIIISSYFEDLSKMSEDLFNQIYLYCNLQLKYNGKNT